MEDLLSEGHARALLGLTDRAGQEELGKRVVQEKLTVREVERLVADWAGALRDGRVRVPKRKNPDLRHMEEELQRLLGRRIVLDARGKTKGWVKLEFYSIDDLDVLVRQLKSLRHPK
jgi:ParB family chromosome partitioning protein